MVKQDEVKNKGKIDSVRHTVKSERLRGGEICKDLVCIYLYNIKHVYFSSNACKENRWIENYRQVYDNQ